MIYQLKGKLTKKAENRVILDVGGISYEVNIPQTVFRSLNYNLNDEVQLVIYHYFNINKNRGVPVMIGFINELERDFFEKFISVSGIGPKAALKAFDKPMPVIAAAIEEGDVEFLKTLAGVGKQKAKQIVLSLQGKVGRFALIKEGQEKEPIQTEVVKEAKEVLKKLQYSAKEAEDMIKKVLSKKPDVNSVEELLNEIYRQRG